MEIFNCLISIHSEEFIHNDFKIVESVGILLRINYMYLLPVELEKNPFFIDLKSKII